MITTIDSDGITTPQNAVFVVIERYSPRNVFVSKRIEIRGVYSERHFTRRGITQLNIALGRWINNDVFILCNGS